MYFQRFFWPAFAMVMALAPNIQAESIEGLRAGFVDPPIEYHTVPSWWWDGSDLVTTARIDWQLEQLKSQGIDVVCLTHHVPFNLKPKYQTEHWWDLVKHMVAKAAALEMKVWISDGIAWGSPLINNTVLEENPSFVGQILSHLETSTVGPGPVSLEIPNGLKVLEILGVYAYPSEAGTIDLERARDLSKLVEGRKLAWEAPTGEWTVMLFYSRPGYYQEGGDYQSFIGPGRGEPLDYMNPKAMQRLFDVTLGEYERQLGRHLGTTVVATFQDELLTSHGYPAISPYLFSAFRDRKGYDLLPYLGALYRDAGRMTPKIRCDYHDVRTHLLEEAFFKPEFEWYEDRGMMIAHDQFGRGSLIGQVSQYGDYFRTMRWYQAPGSDDWHEARAGRNLRDIKMAASIAHMYQRPRVFSEALHTAGWGLTMEQQRQVVNEEYVMGVNLYDEILFNYSTHGSWFEWAPAATMFRQPYFRHKRLFNDYVNRLSYVMSQGRHVAEVAVLYPVTSLQANMGGTGANQKARLITAAFYQLCEQLFYDGIDFDIIDEDSIQRATVSNGRLEVAGESFPILVLPPVTAIKRETLAQIRRFYDDGGLVIAGTLLPLDSPEAGTDDEQNIRTLEGIFGFDPQQAKDGTVVASHNESREGGKSFFLPEGLSDAPKLIRGNIEMDFDSSLPQLLAHHRRIADRDFYLIYNSSDQRTEGKVRVRTKGQPEIWNSETGSIKQVYTFRAEETHTSLDLAFNPYEALLIALSREAPPCEVHGSEFLDLALSRGSSPLTVTGRSRSSGEKHLDAMYQGRAYEGSVSVAKLPEPVRVKDQWRFSVEPTLDNQWGDFRLPVTEQNRWIGAEIRQFLYRQEGESDDGTELGWAEADFEASDWENVVYTVGPYWWIIPAFPTRGGPALLDEAFIRETRINVQDTYEYQDQQLRWQPYSFSQQFGRLSNGFSVI